MWELLKAWFFGVKVRLDPDFDKSSFLLERRRTGQCKCRSECKRKSDGNE